MDWKYSKEKERLKKDIISGLVTDEMSQETVYNMYDGTYHKFPFKSFKRNLKNLKSSIIQSKKISQVDEVAHTNTLKDMTIDRATLLSWQGSQAQVSISALFKSGYLSDKTPKDIYDMNPSYSEFNFKQFSDNFYKEKHKGKAKVYWALQREKKEEKRAKKNEPYQKQSQKTENEVFYRL